MLEGEPLPVVEITPTEEDRYSYEARYEIGRTRFDCPAALGAEEAAAVNAAAVATWESLRCEGFARVDLMLDSSGPHVLEVNSIPGLTDTSLFPMAAEAAGMDFETLVERIVRHAARRGAVPAA
jgi:D-alanine-D-alanine ligase